MQLKSLLKFLPLTLITLLFTSCFDILEDISMNADGSGNATFKVDMSQSKQELKNYMNVGKVNDVKLPTKEDMIREMKKVEAAFAAEEGISNVDMVRDFENFVFTFKCSFNNLNTLNKAINNVTKKMAKGPFPIPKLNHFAYSSGKFTRHFDYPMGFKKYEDMSFTERFLLESATYTTVYRFPRSVKSSSNNKSEISASKKAVKLATPLSGFVKQEVSLKNEISF